MLLPPHKIEAVRVCRQQILPMIHISVKSSNEFQSHQLYQISTENELVMEIHEITYADFSPIHSEVQEVTYT